MAMWLFRGSVFRSGSGYQIGLGDWAMGWLTRGTEESVLQVQLVPIYSGFIKFECKVKETSGTRQAWDLCQNTLRPQTCQPLYKKWGSGVRAGANGVGRSTIMIFC